MCSNLRSKLPRITRRRIVPISDWKSIHAKQLRYREKYNLTKQEFLRLLNYHQREFNPEFDVDIFAESVYYLKTVPEEPRNSYECFIKNRLHYYLERFKFNNPPDYHTFALSDSVERFADDFVEEKFYLGTSLQIIHDFWIIHRRDYTRNEVFTISPDRDYAELKIGAMIRLKKESYDLIITEGIDVMAWVNIIMNNYLQGCECVEIKYLLI